MYKLVVLAGALASATAFLDSLKHFGTSNCTNDQFYCGNFECIPMSQQCDGSTDCSDGSDEHDCELHTCKKPDFFRCKNGRCISGSFVCDSENDCDDFSDEENCKEFLKELNQKNFTCPENQWQCSDKMCISQEWVCNGEPDCLDGSDETLGCSSTINCDGFKCKNGHCVFKEWRCDGHDDCMDNSDEENCDVQINPEECTTQNQEFLCSDGKTCIKLNQVCDGTTQCPDKSDEGTACTKDCEDCPHQCVHLPEGPKCICPKGYQTIDTNHCEDINECEIYGICDQKCRNTPGSYQCYCDENYSLQEDKRSCKAHFGEATMFFSTKKEIRAYFLRSEIYFSVSKNLKQVVGVDYDGEYVYWTDIFSEHESIVRSLKNGEKKELLVTSGLGAPEDLHVDHITKNIYFTDVERQHIGVCTNDGTYCTVLVNKDVQKPRGIVLHSHEGEMYWTDWGQRPEIARAYMDGTNDTSFVSNDIHWPNGLTIDYPNSRLYWTDAKLMTLESIRLDGTDRRVVLEGIVKHPYAIAVFESRLYWSDWSTHSIQSCDKFTGKNHHTLIKEHKEFIYGISIYHPNNHKKHPSNACAHSRCSDLCLLKATTYTCACPEDRELGPDAHTCRDVGKKQHLVLATDNMLMEVEHKALGKHQVVALGVVVKKIGALTYDSVDNKLYVSDLDIRKVIGVELDTGVAKPVGLGDVGAVTAMDFDYLGRNLYWCDTQRRTVEVYSFNTQSRTVLIHDMREETPQSIALVPEEGVMFVAFRRSEHFDSHVDRFLMDGTSRTHPMESGLLGPVSLHYDPDLHRVFMADAGTGNIESTSVEGDDRHGFRSLQTSPIGITSLKSDIFWVNKYSHNIFWADKYNRGDGDYNKKITLDLPKDFDRMYVTSVTPRRVGLSPCQKDNGGCSHLCLQSHQKIICACPIGLFLDFTNKTCTKRTICSPYDFFCDKSNTCISNKFRCDGTKNCQNGEDEDNCQTPHCPLNYFQCQDGECINEIYRCDFKYDCRDKSDERNCSHVATKKCPPKHFMCKNEQCINERLVCDGVTDCKDEEDEANCVSTVCKKSEFRCLSGACIPKDWECDRDYDCADFSDEHSGCTKCDSSTFPCSNGKCVDKSFVCDGENDCGDNSDELECDKIDTSTTKSPQDGCQQDEYRCDNGKCVPKDWICDQYNDCGDNSDENATTCNQTIPEPDLHIACEDKFQCKTGTCIDLALICDGKPDCFDSSDEDGVCNTSCNSLNNPCSQICVKTPTGPMCKCNDGYYLQGDGQTCENMDECAQNPPVCGQICHDIPGSYLCDCFEGFALRTDRTSCKAEGKAMTLIFSLDTQIRAISKVDNSLKLVHSGDTTRITGLDVSADANTIYFSVENTGTIIRITQNESKTEFMEDVGLPQKLALDWITNNVYYVNNDPLSKSIAVCNFDQKSCSNLVPVDLHRQVSAIAVDAANNLLFYSLASWWVFNSPNYVLYRSNLDGTDVQELIKSTSGYLTGISFDSYKKELYCSDQHNGQVIKIKYDGTKRVTLWNMTKPTGLSFFENDLFVLTKKSGSSMNKCKLYTPATCDFYGFKADLFAIAQESKYPTLSENPCKNHTCSHLCVSSNTGFKCLCEDGKLVTPGEECGSTNREASGDDRRRVLTIHHHEHYSGTNPGPVIAGVMISICLLTFAALICYAVKRRNSGTFNVISMRFQNPGYGLHHDQDESQKAILQPGQHEYVNPVEFFDAVGNDVESRREEMLVNV